MVIVPRIIKPGQLVLLAVSLNDLLQRASDLMAVSFELPTMLVGISKEPSSFSVSCTIVSKLIRISL